MEDLKERGPLLRNLTTMLTMARRAFVLRFTLFNHKFSLSKNGAVIQFAKILKVKIGKKPLFLMGYSMGGQISFFTALREQQLFKGSLLSFLFLFSIVLTLFQGVVLICPALLLHKGNFKKPLLKDFYFLPSLRRCKAPLGRHCRIP